MRQAEAFLPTHFGAFKIIAYAENPDDLMPNIALVHRDFDARNDVTIRIHSECMTGDVLGSKKCDCGEQLHAAMEIIAAEKGVLIYLRQEGRGIGLINKIKAYALQEQGMDTIESNTHLGFEADERQYAQAIEILKDLCISRVKLITNNPLKVKALEDARFAVTERIPLIIAPNEQNRGYMETKKLFMGHFY
jgi:GTP cyclohydrolase II